MRVQEPSLQPYLSAINSAHLDLEYERPAVGHAITAYRHGLAHMQAAQQPAGRRAERTYLPAPCVERALLWALELDLGTATRRQLKLFRAAVATVFTFTFFARGGTGAALLDEHVTRSAAGVTVKLEHEKGKGRRQRARALTLPPGAIPGLDELLLKWERFRGVVKPTRSYYAMPGEKGKPPSTAIDTWLREVLAHFGFSPPSHEKWSGHSLRKGAASAAAAIDIRLERICHMGGWQIGGSSVHDYIDPTCPATPAARRFYGWLRAA